MIELVDMLEEDKMGTICGIIFVETSILYHPVGNNGVPDLKNPFDDG